MWDSGPKRLTKGWTLYPIVTYRTGAPLNVNAGIANRGSRTGPSGAGDANLTLANQVLPVNYFDPHQTQTLTDSSGTANSGNYYFNPAAFSADFSSLAPGQYTYGSSGRNGYRGPDRVNFDLSVAKTTNLYAERVKLEIRADFFNVLNHTQFHDPTTTIGSNLFGQISDTYDPRIIQLAARFTF